MVYLIDDLASDKKQVREGKWVIARPENYKHRTLKERLADAIAVFKGQSDAVNYIDQ